MISVLPKSSRNPLWSKLLSSVSGSIKLCNHIDKYSCADAPQFTRVKSMIKRRDQHNNREKQATYFSKLGFLLEMLLLPYQVQIFN